VQFNKQETPIAWLFKERWKGPTGRPRIWKLPRAPLGPCFRCAWHKEQQFHLQPPASHLPPGACAVAAAICATCLQQMSKCSTDYSWIEIQAANTAILIVESSLLNLPGKALSQIFQHSQEPSDCEAWRARGIDAINIALKKSYPPSHDSGDCAHALLPS
jgi:hypothetical protein